jgi:hypothetical protein
MYDVPLPLCSLLTMSQGIMFIEIVTPKKGHILASFVSNRIITVAAIQGTFGQHFMDSATESV